MEDSVARVVGFGGESRGLRQSIGLVAGVCGDGERGGSDSNASRAAQHGRRPVRLKSDIYTAGRL